MIAVPEEAKNDIQKIIDAAAVLVASKPRKEAVRPLQSPWGVSQLNKHNKPKLLPDVICELKSKVLKAAQKLQQDLAASVEQPVVNNLTDLKFSYR